MNHCMRALRKEIERGGLASVALPRLATGVGGLDWDDVAPVIARHLGTLEIPVYVDYIPGAKAAITQVVEAGNFQTPIIRVAAKCALRASPPDARALRPRRTAGIPMRDPLARSRGADCTGAHDFAQGQMMGVHDFLRKNLGSTACTQGAANSRHDAARAETSVVWRGALSSSSRGDDVLPPSLDSPEVAL